MKTIKKLNVLSKAVKLSILGGALFSVQTVYAQDSVQSTAAESPVEKIQVTGSRILREGAIAPSPVTVLTGESLVNTGAMNIGEALNELPALASTYSLANSGRYIGTAGLNILDLRGMGTDRTLVLVDGKRHVSSSAGSAAVDVNTIPTTWIERVEIITGGASAVYGADAVTGVVNFVLKDKIEGLEVSATKGFADNNDYENEKFTFSYGTNFDNDKGNVAISFEYGGQDSLNQLDNPWTATSYTSMSYESIYGQSRTDEQLNSVDYPDKIYTPNAGYYAINNAGVFGYIEGFYGWLPADSFYSFNPDGSLHVVERGDTVDNLYCAGDCDFFNLGQFNEIQPEFNRSNVNFKVNYDITDDANIYLQAKYARTRSQDIGQPAYFFANTDNFISRDNAFLHPTVAALLDEYDAPGIFISRMLTDLGRRVEDDTRETERYIAGITGTLDDVWDYEGYVNYGKTELERVNGNNLIYENYFNAIDAIELDDGSIVCRDEEARASGCQPLNIMGYGAPSQEAIDYVNTVSIGHSKIQQLNAGASISNSSIYELPAGYVGFAAGVEYRKEKSEVNEPDNAEGTFFNVLGEDKGEFNVKEVYAELSVPLLTDLPGVQDLTLDTALRIADYSTIGNAKSWKLGLDWQVYDDLRIRSTYSSALRAPNIGELFGQESQNFFNVDDPCKTDNLDDLANSETRRANCAALGVPADFNSQYDSASIEGVSGGNENLDAEESKSTTIGLVYQPAFLEGFVATIDYWKIELTDAISAVGAQDILDRCVDSETGIDNDYCKLITRDENSEIINIKQYALNLSGQDAEGVDFEFGYDFDALSGSFRTSLLGTYLRSHKSYPFQEDPSDYYEYAGTTGEPKWQGMLTIAYTKDQWEITSKTRYLDRVSLYTDQELEDNPNPSSLMEFASYVVTDVTAGYNFDNGLSIKLGVDNLFNRRLPLGTSGTGSGSASYDNIGRFGYLTVSYKM